MYGCNFQVSISLVDLYIYSYDFFLLLFFNIMWLYSKSSNLLV